MPVIELGKRTKRFEATLLVLELILNGAAAALYLLFLPLLWAFYRAVVLLDQDMFLLQEGVENPRNARLHAWSALGFLAGVVLCLILSRYTDPRFFGGAFLCAWMYTMLTIIYFLDPVLAGMHRIKEVLIVAGSTVLLIVGILASKKENDSTLD